MVDTSGIYYMLMYVDYCFIVVFLFLFVAAFNFFSVVCFSILVFVCMCETLFLYLCSFLFFLYMLACLFVYLFVFFFFVAVQIPKFQLFMFVVIRGKVITKKMKKKIKEAVRKRTDYVISLGILIFMSIHPYTCRD